MFLEPEWIAGLRNIHCPELSGPFVHVLKDVVVNGLNVPGIECAGKGLLFKLTETPSRGFRFELA